MTLGDPGRDSRGHVISIVYYALMDAQTLLSSMDLTRAQLIPVEKMTAMEMAYDHADIVAHARKRLEWRMEYTNIARNILPPRFSLTRLQESYETVFGRALDKRNFRKKILSTGALRETDELDRTSSNRPARLYEFIDEQLETAIES